MDVRRLNLLRELAERGSVTAVAAALHLTPSAVSQQLKELEREAGTPLTERSGRGLALTANGRVLAETAREVSVAIAKAESTWAAYVEQPQGEVTLTVFPTAGQMLLPGVLTRVEAVPGLRVVCSDQDPLLADFADLTSDHDIVIADASGVTASWRERGLVTVALMREPLDIAMPEGHPLAERSTLSPADVISQPWIGVPDSLPFDRILQRIEALTGQQADVRQRFFDNRIIEELVARGHGIAILPRFTTRDHVNGIVTRPLDGVRSERIVWALMRPEVSVRPSVRVVVEALEAEAEAFAAAHAYD